MKKITVFVLATMLSVLNIVQAQKKCPTISMASPDLVKEGEQAIFSVSVTGGDAGSSFTYNWSVSSGTIQSGQGTNVIYVDTKNLGGQSITATVELGGAPKDCSITSSATTMVNEVPKTELHTKGDYSTAKAFTDEAGKFAGDFMSAYYAAGETHAIVFLYPAKTANAATALKQMTSTIRSTFAVYGILPAMYKIITAGKRERTSYEMWIVPKDGKEPQATL